MLLGDIGGDIKAGRRRQTERSPHAAVPSPGFHAGQPGGTAEEALSYFQNALVEDKYDGIRAQAHCSGGEVRIFSRTRDEITESFPELPEALAGLPQDAILDGEIVAWSLRRSPESPNPGQALPFSTLQQRLGRKKPSEN